MATSKTGYYQYRLVSKSGNEEYGVTLKSRDVSDLVKTIVEDSCSFPEEGFTLEIKRITYNEARKWAKDKKQERKDFVKKNYDDWVKRGRPSE
jgi:hypothetical protein